MGKRKSDRLEEMFQDIDSEFYGITEDIAKLRIREIEDYIVKTNETKIRELEERIAKKQALIEELQGKDGAENSTRIQNVIKTAEEELKEAQEQLKAQKTCVSRMEKEKTYIQGYARNSSQIKQIRAFKESIAKKIPAEIKKRDESKAKMEVAEELLKDANKKLADEKLTMEMDQYEYNALLEQKAQAEKDVKEQTEIYKKAKDRILELQTKMGKCDLAWKTLFTGKSWDDIQRRALDPNTKFVRYVKEDEKLKPAEGKGKRPAQLLEEEQLREDIAKTVDQVKDEQGENKEGEKTDLPAPTPKHPRWEKFKNFFKNAGHKIKQIFVRGDKSEKQEEPDYSKMDEIPVDKRDQFLEELRRHVDKEYGKEVREQKEARYIEQHQAKTKTSESQKKDDEIVER